MIGPGLLRTQQRVESRKLKVESLEEINKLEDEGEQSYYLTKYLLAKYPHKKWVIDAGALQMMETEWLFPLRGNVIITPHSLEFLRVFGKEFKMQNAKVKIAEQNSKIDEKYVKDMAQQYNVIILLKGREDFVCYRIFWRIHRRRMTSDVRLTM